MKTKDTAWYDDKIQDIKKRKRSLRNIQEPDMVKKIKKDLEKEKRSAKHAVKGQLREWLKEEIYKFENK